MTRLLRLFLAVASILTTSSAQSKSHYRIVGPFSHANLAIYLVHGKSAEGPVPLTLQEALSSGKIVVHETGTVSRLEIESTADEQVFVQAGDIVKGGQQDRVLTVSLLVPPRSGRLPISAYCVEYGRWAARGKEDVHRFLSAEKSLPSRGAKMALLGMLEPGRETPAEVLGMARQPSSTLPVQQRAAPGQGPNALEDRERILREHQVRRQPDARSTSAQGEIWRNVAETQRKLSESLRTTVAAAQSASSLQLTLENQKLAEVRAAYISALKTLGFESTAAIGLVVAVNGKLASADIYPSNGLFRKMWNKLLEAAATEAIGEKDTGSAAPAPSAEVAHTFLDAAERGRPSTSKIDVRTIREARDGGQSILVQTTGLDGALVHRSFIAK